MGPVNRYQPFVFLPFELLEEIYVLSETLALTYVCPRFYISFNARSTRLRFCTRLFYVDNPRRDLYLSRAYLRDKQTEILAQEWFDTDFTISLKEAVMHIRANDRTGNNVRSELSSNTYHAETNAQTHFFFFVSDVHLPSRLLCGPWSKSKINLLRYLYLWGLRTKPSDELKRFESMKGTIGEGNWQVLKILLQIGIDLSLKDFKDLVLCGRGSIVQKLFDWVRTESPGSHIYWRSAVTSEWVTNNRKEELEKRGTY